MGGGLVDDSLVHLVGRTVEEPFGEQAAQDAVHVPVDGVLTDEAGGARRLDRLGAVDDAGERLEVQALFNDATVFFAET